MEKIRVIIAEHGLSASDPLARQFKSSQWIELIDVAQNQMDALKLLTSHDCDVLVIGDAFLFSIDPEERLTPEFARMCKVIRTGLTERTQLLNFLKAGFQNLVSTEDTVNELIRAVLMAHQGLSSLSACLCKVMWGLWQAQQQYPAEWKELLSRREQEVLRLFLNGMGVTEIAQQTGRAVKTISTQKMSAMRKMNINNDVQLLWTAFHHGWH